MEEAGRVELAEADRQQLAFTKYLYIAALTIGLAGSLPLKGGALGTTIFSFLIINIIVMLHSRGEQNTGAKTRCMEILKKLPRTF